MYSSTVLSTQLVPFLLRKAEVGEEQVGRIVRQASDEEIAVTGRVVTELLRDLAASGTVGVSDPAAGASSTFNSAFIRGELEGAGVKVVAFSFADAAQESLVALFSLAVTAFSGQWGLANVASAISLAKTLWSNLSTLRSPEDDDAISTFRGLGALRASTREEPSNAALVDVTALEPGRLAAALKLLNARKIIKVAQWGAQSDDFSHPANTWTVRF